MMTDSYAAKDIGTTMGFMGISYMIVAVLGPQLGFSVPFVPMLIICGALCIVGGFISKLACSLLNKYYKSNRKQVHCKSLEILQKKYIKICINKYIKIYGSRPYILLH